MKTYYCVTNTYDDKGRVTSAITNIVEAEKKPESTFTCTDKKDIYNDWFDSQKEAEAFVEEAKRL